jgi:hypothetical protein
VCSPHKSKWGDHGRGGEKAKAMKLPTEPSDNAIDINDISTFSDLGLITPPQLLDSEFHTDGLSHEDDTSIHHGLGLTDALGVSQSSSIECVLSIDV